MITLVAKDRQMCQVVKFWIPPYKTSKFPNRSVTKDNSRETNNLDAQISGRVACPCFKRHVHKPQGLQKLLPLVIVFCSCEAVQNYPRPPVRWGKNATLFRSLILKGHQRSRFQLRHVLPREVVHGAVPRQLSQQAWLARSTRSGSAFQRHKPHLPEC